MPQALAVGLARGDAPFKALPPGVGFSHSEEDDAYYGTAEHPKRGAPVAAAGSSKRDHRSIVRPEERLRFQKPGSRKAVL